MNQDLSTRNYGVVMVTVSSQKEGETLATSIIEAQMAACVSIFPINSIYTWQGKIHSASEWQLLIKTDLAQFSQLEKKIIELHSYEVPEIIALPIVAGSQPYFKWLNDHIKTG
jgi:periplasmic divalent cation tolerance protein